MKWDEIQPPTLALAHEYAVLFAEYQRRTNHIPFSTRERFKNTTDTELIQELDEVKEQLAAIDKRKER